MAVAAEGANLGSGRRGRGRSRILRRLEKKSVWSAAAEGDDLSSVTVGEEVGSGKSSSWARLRCQWSGRRLPFARMTMGGGAWVRDLGKEKAIGASDICVSHVAAWDPVISLSHC